MNSAEPSSSPDASDPPVRPDLAPLPPGRFGLPVLGETLALLRSPVRFHEERSRRYGEVYRSHVFGSKTVFISDPEANQWLFAGEGKSVQSMWPYSTRRLFGPLCVSLLQGAEHLERRRLLAPFFSYAAMRGFVPTIEAIARRHFDRWVDQGGVLTVWPAMRVLAFEIAVTLIFGQDGVDIPYLTERFQTWTAGLFSAFPVGLPFTPFGRALKAREELLAYIDARVTARQQCAEQPHDVLGALLSARDDAGRPLSREAIDEEILVLLFAGHDTTVTATSNLLLQLAQHPEVLQAGRAQLDAAPEGPLTLDGLKAIPFLFQAINEGMRCAPPVGGVFRKTTQDVVFQGYRIPKGWSVSVNIRATHYGKNWAAPERFDPSRFGAEGKVRQGAFIPFSGGVRICVGQHFAMVEMSVMLALLLRGYAWALEPGQDLTYDLVPFPRPKSGIRLRFTRRAGA